MKYFFTIAFLFLILFYNLTKSLTVCPDGFDPSTQFMKMNSCWKYMPDLLDQAAADAECLKNNGAALVMISSCEVRYNF